MTHSEFKTLFDKEFAKVRNYVFYRSGNTEVATDIAQETFLAIWEKQNKINIETVKGLLYKIANDKFVSFYRKEKRSFDFFNHFEIDSNENTPEEIIQFNELKKYYKKALAQMPEKQRTVFLMSRAENLKYREIAEIIGLSEKAVEKRMKGALEHLRTFLKEK